jgi:hypothetical protein
VEDDRLLWRGKRDQQRLKISNAAENVSADTRMVEISAAVIVPSRIDFVF